MSEHITAMEARLQALKSAKKPGDTSKDDDIAFLESTIAAAKRAASAGQSTGSGSGFFSDILGGIWNNLGTFIMIAIAAAIAYAVFGKEKLLDFWEASKDFLDKGVDWLIEQLPESLQPNLKKGKAWVASLFGGDVSGHLLAEPVDSVIADLEKATGVDKAILKTHIKDDAEKNALVDFLKKANGNKLGTDDFTSSKSIYALMTSEKYSPLLQEIAKAALKGGADDKLDVKKAEPILKSLREIVKDERLDSLLTTHRSNTIAMLKAIKPEAASTIENLIADGMEHNKATPALRELLTTMLTLDSAGKLPGKPVIEKAAETYAKQNPKAAVTLLDEFLTSDQGRIFAENNGGKAFAALQKHMGEKINLANLLMTYQDLDGDKLAQMKFALDNRPAFDAYSENADLKSLPPAYRTPLEHLRMIPKGEATATVAGIMGRGIDPLPLRSLVPSNGQLTTNHLVKELLTNAPQRDLIQKIGAEDVLKVAHAFAKDKGENLPAMLTAKNLNAVLKAANEIGAKIPADISRETYEKLTPEQRNEHRANMGVREQTLQVFTSLTDALANHNPAALKTITPQQLAVVFSNKHHQEAMHLLLINLELPADQAKARDVLTRGENWAAIAALAADKENGAKFVLERLTEFLSNGDNCKAPDKLKQLGIFMDGGIIFKNTLGQNLPRIELIGMELQQLMCQNNSATALPPARANAAPAAALVAR